MEENKVIDGRASNGGSRTGAGRPRGSFNRTTKGNDLRNTVKDLLGRNIDEEVANTIMANVSDIEMVKVLLPYLYHKMPQKSHVSVDSEVPLLTIGLIDNSKDKDG